MLEYFTECSQLSLTGVPNCSLSQTGNNSQPEPFITRVRLLPTDLTPLST